ncbi:MAG: AI-2E family transporter [Gemmatales bacterium]
MPDMMKTVRWQRSVLLLTHIVLVVVALAALYLLREVFLPLALAIFFSFLLYPLFKFLQKRGVPRKLAVVTVVLSTLLTVGGGVWIVSAQLSNLAGELPNYSKNITKKLTALKEMTAGSGKWKNFTEEITSVINGKVGQPTESDVPSADKEANQPARVVVQEASPRWVSWVSSHASSALGFLAELALALVLTLFILLNREDMLNRVLKLAGQHRASLTSKAVTETGNRVTRFLVVQFMVNSTFGLLLAGCLFLLGVNYALLWGFLTAVLRYLPYIGPWLAAIFPLTLSLAQFDGWWQPVIILSFYLALEIICSNIVEPYLYGQSIGVSEVALLISAAFWAWMWGPVGLVLSAPLTVVLVVLGKYVSELHYLTVLFSDEPPLSKDMSIYQRLLAQDHDEADRLIQERQTESDPEKVYDELLIPSLNHMKLDQQRHVIDQEEVKEVQVIMNELLDDMTIRHKVEQEEELTKRIEVGTRINVLGYAVRDISDHLAMTMLGKLLDDEKWNYELAPANALSSEILEQLKQPKFDVLCLGMIQPGSTAHVRHLCKKIRMQFPEVKILVGMWGPEKISEEKARALQEAGADWVGNTLQEASNTLSVWYPIWSEQSQKQVA